MTIRSLKAQLLMPARPVAGPRPKARRPILKPARGLRPLTQKQKLHIFDQAAERALQMSGEEFLRRWDAGEFQPLIDQPEHHSKIMSVAMLLPLVRSIPARHAR